MKGQNTPEPEDHHGNRGGNRTPVYSVHEGNGSATGHKRPQTPPEPYPGEEDNYSHLHRGHSPPEQQQHVPAVPSGGPRTPPGPPICGPRTPPSPMDRMDDSPGRGSSSRGGSKRDYRDGGNSVSPPPSKRSRRGSRDRSRSRDRERSRGSRRTSRDRYRSPR